MNRFLKLFILTLTLVALTSLSVSAFSDTTDAQIWRIIPSYEKTYRILNVASGLFLDVDLAKAADGTNVKLYYQNDDFEAQNWYFMPE